MPLVGRHKAFIWPQKLGLVAKNYQGEMFEGNHCRILLEKGEKLYDHEICGEVGQLAVMPFVAILRDVNKIVTSFFTAGNVDDPNIYEYLDDFCYNFCSTELSETLKLHILIEHIPHSLHFLNNKGLGSKSEKATESCHREFKKYWEKYKFCIN